LPTTLCLHCLKFASARAIIRGNHASILFCGQWRILLIIDSALAGSQLSTPLVGHDLDYTLVDGGLEDCHLALFEPKTALLSGR